jgi:GNAT superfamily N-acetyltransferase
VITIERVPWDDPRGVALRAAMDVDMHERYDVHDGVEESPDVTAERDRVLAVHPAQVVTSLLAIDDDGTPVGTITVRRLPVAESREEIELKRLMVLAAARGKGAAKALLAECEVIGRELHAPRLILQTGDRQPEAVALYEKTGWTRIPIFGDYEATMPFSLCFEKVLA